MIRRAHAGEMFMRELRTQLRANYARIYRRMADLGLPYRRPDCRTRPAVRRGYPIPPAQQGSE